MVTRSTIRDSWSIQSEAIWGAALPRRANNNHDQITGTSLFDIDNLFNQVVIQSPPKDSSLVAIGMLSVDADSQVRQYVQQKGYVDATHRTGGPRTVCFGAT